MRILMFLLVIFVPVTVLAADAPVKLRLRPARLIELTCLVGTSTRVISGSTDELTVARVGDLSVRYEIYVDDFFMAACESVFVTK